MKSDALFVHLVWQLRHHADAAVLWVLLKIQADVNEHRTTSMLMSHVDLAGQIDRKAAQRSFKRLSDLGLIRLRIHSKTATLITVNRQQVLDLLDKRLACRLPGLDPNSDFPFLHAWAAQHGQRADNT